MHCEKYISSSIPTCPYCGAINIASVGGGQGVGTPLDADKYRHNNVPEQEKDRAESRSVNGRTEKNRKNVGKILVIWIMVYLLISSLPSIIRILKVQKALSSSSSPSGDSAAVKEESARSAEFGKYYYAQDDGVLYYCGGISMDEGSLMTEWWSFDKDTEEWTLTELAAGIGSFAEGLSAENEYDLRADELDYLEELNYSDVNILHSYAYIDAGHHPEPDYMRYYELDGRYYYYYNDLYSLRADEEDQTGWYIYDKKKGWIWYCAQEDQDTLGPELWYKADQYVICTQWSFDDEVAKEWGITDFQDTEFVKKSLEAKEKMEKEND